MGEESNVVVLIQYYTVIYPCAGPLRKQHFDVSTPSGDSWTNFVPLKWSSSVEWNLRAELSGCVSLDAIDAKFRPGVSGPAPSSRMTPRADVVAEDVLQRPLVRRRVGDARVR